MPTAYVAFKREYYVEALSYFSIFLSSSFYHACDAGENIISVCVFRLGALQFADFFSALLGIWLTLLAMADLPAVHLSLLQMGGSIIIAFCVTLNRYAFWIFALPSSVGVIIIGISWYLKYRKFSSQFIDKRYLTVNLPVGLTVVLVGLIIYGLLQTENNYKYLHSLWHAIMATGVYFLLPKQDTFQAAALLAWYMVVLRVMLIVKFKKHVLYQLMWTHFIQWIMILTVLTNVMNYDITIKFTKFCTNLSKMFSGLIKNCDFSYYICVCAIFHYSH